jgi:hypothetical protein
MTKTCYKEWTCKRLENVCRIRQYATHVERVGDEERPVSCRMVQEFHLTTRELGEFMAQENIEEFTTETEMDIQAQLLAGEL